jgi:hypothetical protein
MFSKIRELVTEYSILEIVFHKMMKLHQKTKSLDEEGPLRRRRTHH